MRCVICGSKLKDDKGICTSCGASQDLEPTYYAYINVEKYLKENNISEIPNKDDYNFIQDGKYMIPKDKSKYDIIALSSCSIGLYFTFKLIVNMSEGINSIITQNDGVVKSINNPIIKILLIVWPIILFPLVAFIYSKKARKIKKTQYNIYSYLGSILELSYAGVATIILFINMIN